MLNPEQRQRTAQELDANLTACRLTVQQVAGDLAWSPGRLRSTLAVTGADPVDVWQLRDHLEHAARAAGDQPVAYTVLTEHARAAARDWFPLHQGPRRATTTP